MSDQPEAPDAAIWIDGTPVTVDDLTYREQREMRKLVKELSGEPDIDPINAAEVDFIPAIITVVKQRSEPDFTVDQALEYKPGDLEAPKRPTKPAAKKRAAKT